MEMLKGRQLQKELKRLGLKQTDTARILDISPASLSNILTEQVDAKVDARRRLEKLIEACTQIEQAFRKI